MTWQISRHVALKPEWCHPSHAAETLSPAKNYPEAPSFVNGALSPLRAPRLLISDASCCPGTVISGHDVKRAGQQSTHRHTVRQRPVQVALA